MKLDWEEVKDLKTLSRIKTVEEMVPIPAESQIGKSNPRIWEEQYRIIEDCLRMDCTVKEACDYAWISTVSYNNHKKSNPDFAIRVERAKQFPKMMARAAVMKRISQWDAKTALEYLKLRDKYRYNTVPWLDEEWEREEAGKVQFISIPSNEWQSNTTSPDTQNDIKLSSASEWYASSWESERMTARENEEEVLRRLDSASFSSE